MGIKEEVERLSLAWVSVVDVHVMLCAFIVLGVMPVRYT